MSESIREHPISEVASAFGLAVSALRYYDDIGIVPCAGRRNGVRAYDERALLRLAYVQLWHEDALLPLADAREIVDSARVADRLKLIAGKRDELRVRIERMERAVSVLTHMLGCTSDDAISCAYTGAYLRAKVAEALDGGDPPRDFFPIDVPG